MDTELNEEDLEQVLEEAAVTLFKGHWKDALCSPASRPPLSRYKVFPLLPNSGDLGTAITLLTVFHIRCTLLSI